MSTAWPDILREEFEGGDGSFLIQLRCDLHWDQATFSRLTEAMLEACRHCSGEDKLERWIAEGFWYLSHFVRDWTGHPNFPRSLPADDVERACQRLDDLAFWYFTGQSPYQDESGFEPI